MAENSKIEWTDHTFNPWIGCTKVSAGCKHCYAETQDNHRKWTEEGWGPGKPRKRTSAAYWKQPHKWNRKAEKESTRYKVFCASLADVFDEEAPQAWREALWQMIEETPYLDWLLLTKRPENIMSMVPLHWREGEEAWCRSTGEPVKVNARWPQNAWLGTTVENQDAADERIPLLLQCPAPVRFLSCEPLLGPVSLTIDWASTLACNGEKVRGECCEGSAIMGECFRGVDWVICGGESGPNARPMHPLWARWLRDQCVEARVPFLFKQWGEHRPATRDDPDRWSGVMMARDGRIKSMDEACDPVQGDVLMLRAGKKNTGRLLDGEEWLQVPGEKS